MFRPHRGDDAKRRQTDERNADAPRRAQPKAGPNGAERTYWQ
jgi:hypothetical protein